MMSDGMLSQDEIDALLNGTSDEEEIEEQNNITDNEDTSGILSEIERDALGEIGNISFGSSATTLATLLNQKVDITTPEISIVRRNQLEKEFPHPHVGVEVEYTEGFEGENLFVLKSSDAAIIADLMLGGDGSNDQGELSEIHMSAVQEAMNQMMGTAATSMSTMFSKRIDISPPQTVMLEVGTEETDKHIPTDEFLVKVSFQLKIGTLIDSKIMQLLPTTFAKAMVDELLNGPAEQPKQAEPATQQQTMSQPVIEQQVHPVNTQPSYTQAPQVSYQQTEQRQPKSMGEPMSHQQNIEQASFQSFEPIQLPEQEKRNLDMLLDIPLQVTVELGRTKRAVKDILELSTGSILELDKLAGEPVDIHVNNKLIAQGEVVVIDENFGVRVTEIISQSDRLKKLR
ncbi:flagellar motor switch phosphatase FliY [Halolactibacillus alkaliphilus]|uniref:Flagellar motor switch phosphatase FliY n=1 Tax=Halolactibacillus alkaliphilus TaxID=442899 RepID=A0A511WYT7_9BACI|nr:flagellar motor switch phosphatase FliY [Halolactibacillus alkaliphilus]GEN55788.1 flagellar motor switch phosphatase FliY [Halolactibacillus alkaliphilus]GGN64939.1 flagellar motor switch phosphatase FliY [Halolactibacillus alkaliphilus]SFO64650.1 flagellar motor switch protein FliN/FliY [Halolactibacillus alkaliphilus]